MVLIDVDVDVHLYYLFCNIKCFFKCQLESFDMFSSFLINLQYNYCNNSNFASEEDFLAA